MRMLPGATGATDALGASASRRLAEALPCWASPPPHPDIAPASTMDVQTAAARRSREVKLRLLNMSSPVLLSVAWRRM
jgi:hypothetical protein